jgi:hypothetical protein
MEFLKDIFTFIKARKLWWFAPIIIFLLVLGLLLIIGGSSPAIAPFIYTLF